MSVVQARHQMLSEYQKSCPDIINHPRCQECKGKCCVEQSDTECEGLIVTLDPGEELDPILATKAVVKYDIWCIPSTGAPEYKCVFLEDGKCSIYDHRPIRCRKYWCDILLHTDPIVVEWRKTHPKQ